MSDFYDGDLVEVVKDFPWADPDNHRIGARLIVEGDPMPPDSYLDEEYPGMGFGDDELVMVSDPQGMWMGGDDVPVSCLKLVKRGSDQLPTARDIAHEVQDALHDMWNSSVVRVHETGEQSEDGATIYAIGSTPDGVGVQFLVRVGAVERAGS